MSRSGRVVPSATIDLYLTMGKPVIHNLMHRLWTKLYWRLREELAR